jgi:hypothetical protein
MEIDIAQERYLLLEILPDDFDDEQFNSDLDYLKSKSYKKCYQNIDLARELLIELYVKDKRVKTYINFKIVLLPVFD